MTESEQRTIYDIVVNDEDQYSLWPDDQPCPMGWRKIGWKGSETECLAQIRELWTDLTPRSLRESLKNQR